MTSNNLLLDLDQRAASTACREEDIGNEIALDVVLFAGLVTLEELETMEAGLVSAMNRAIVGSTYTCPIPQHGKIKH